MADLNQLSQKALQAAMQGGTAMWGQVGSSSEHVRYAEPMAKKSRKKCFCGCGQKKTHMGMANGVCLVSACEMTIYRWVKTGQTRATTKVANA